MSSQEWITVGECNLGELCYSTMQTMGIGKSAQGLVPWGVKIAVNLRGLLQKWRKLPMSTSRPEG